MSRAGRYGSWRIQAPGDEHQWIYLVSVFCSIEMHMSTHTERETSQGRFVPSICESQIINVDLQMLIFFKARVFFSYLFASQYTVYLPIYFYCACLTSPFIPPPLSCHCQFVTGLIVMLLRLGSLLPSLRGLRGAASSLRCLLAHGQRHFELPSQLRPSLWRPSVCSCMNAVGMLARAHWFAAFG